MERQNIIIIEKNGTYETWGSLTEICKENKQFKYATLKGKKYPFKYKGHTFTKVPFKKRII